MTDELDALRDAASRDDWDGCEAWASARLESATLAIAAETVLGALERDRSRREQERASGSGDGLIDTQRKLFRGIVRVWELGSAVGTVREVRPSRDYAYGVIVEPREGGRVALGIAMTRDLVVAADARTAASARAETQLVLVLTSLAYTTYDGAGVGRSFELAPGMVSHVELRSASAPLLASRWRVERGATLAAWLAHDDVVAVTPAGGRLALASHVVQLEQAVKRLRQKVWLARESTDPSAFAIWAKDLDAVLDKLELLEAWGWTRELEPLRPATDRIVAMVREGTSASELGERIAAELGDDAPT